MPEQTVYTQNRRRRMRSDQGLRCLPLTQQFYTHSQLEKWTLKRCIRKSVQELSNLSKITHGNVEMKF